MSLSRTDNGEETLLKIEGTLDAVNAPELRPTLDAVIGEKRKQINVELSALRLIDSSGVAVFVSLLKRARAYGGNVKLVGLSGQPLAIFKMLQLDRVFPGLH